MADLNQNGNVPDGVPPAAPQVLHIRNVSRPAPSKFDASKGQDVSTFLDQLLVYATNEQWPMQNITAYALDFLDDEPYRFAHALPLAVRQNWDLFSKALIDRFDKDTGDIQMRKMFSGQIKQTADEDIQDFASRVIKQCKKAFPDGAAPDPIMRFVFCIGVLPQYTRRLFDTGPVTLAAAVCTARNLEISDSILPGESTISPAAGSEINSVSTANSAALSKLQKVWLCENKGRSRWDPSNLYPRRTRKYNHSRARPITKGSMTSVSSKYCHICGKNSHLPVLCFFNPSSRRYKPYLIQFCLACHKPGHLLSTCPAQK